MGWPLLAILQAVVSLLLFHDYIFGDKYFAFVDVGSDTFAQFVPTLMHQATPANWASAWTFNIGLGATLAPPVGPFALLAIAGGPEHVLDLRIWVYLAKIFAGGAAFYGFALAIGSRREIALIVALAYSFCCYVTTDGQWDPSSAEFAAYAFLLWAIARHAAHPNSWLIPVTVALAALSGALIYSVGVFVVYAFLAAVIVSGRRRATIAEWLLSIFPQCVLGVLIAAPALLPQAFVLLDSPRVIGPQSGFGDRFAQIFSTNDTITVFVEFAALFHKNSLGVGSQHTGWMNYLEGPGFFAGVLPLLLIPQLWQGSRTDRRILAAGGLVIALFIAFPAIRYLAFGFGLDYFRVNNLWVTLLLLTMFAKALGCVAEFGIHRRLLIGSAAVLAIGLGYLESELRPYFSVPHAATILAFLGAGLLLGLLSGRVRQWRRFASLALVFVAAESAVVNYPSFHAQRKVVTTRTPGYNDATMDALAFIKRRDPGFYRVEKTYNSVSFCDALAQGYMGVKSYWFQGAAAVGFYSDLALLPRRSLTKNFTNWLPPFGGRFALNSLVGVKYMITRAPLDWPGFAKIHEAGGVSVYENHLALPLGVVYEKQVPRDRFLALSLEAKDIAMLNAAIVENLRGDAPRVFDVAQFMQPSADWMKDNYVIPAQELKRRGVAVEHFSHGFITARIATDVPGVLVFSIPYAKGWSLAIDGVERPLFKAHLGMLAADISQGEHRIELRYSLPGLLPGLLVGLLGVFGIWAIGALARRSPAQNPVAQA